MSCERKQLVQAYHDGEMPEARMSEFERHLRACAECLRELEVLRRLSSMVGGMEIPRLSAEAMERMKEHVRVAAERGVLRLAEWLTAAAAAVLLIGMMGLPNDGRIERTQPPVAVGDTGKWQEIALAGPSAETEVAVADPTDPSAWVRTESAQGK